MQTSSGALGIVLTLLVYLVGLITMVFWFVVAWRAMRAHEDLADAVRQISERR